MPEQGYAAGGEDWLAVWRRMYDEERAQAEAATAPGFAIGADFWSAQADRFASAARRSPQPDGFMQLLLPRLRPSDRVVDVGAGSGRYVAQLARAAAEVVAVEPSAAMRGHLERRIADERLANVRIVAEPWPAADVPQADVVIAAHVVYGVREIEAFLRALDAGARRACYLYVAYRHPGSFVSPLWERFHGAPRRPLPGALECLCVLYQLGIPAQLTLVPAGGRVAFADLDEALADVRYRLRLTPDERRDAAIRAAIVETFERRDDGGLMPPNLPTTSTVIWWEHAPEEAR